MPDFRPSALGPSCLSTITCNNISSVVSDYCRYLHLCVAEETTVCEALAELWQCPELVGAPLVLLANEAGEVWLRLVEQTGSVPLEPLKHHGWLALEVLVEDVDALVAGLDGGPFKALRPVSNLELSDNIRACQVEGPCGEVYYLTQIKGDVPPFDLPRARCKVDRLFIPVLCVPDRQHSVSYYEGFPHTRGLSFDTKITVVNQAYELSIEQQHPVATMLLSGQSLIEIDQIAGARSRPDADIGLPANIASVGFEVDDLDALTIPWNSRPRRLHLAPYGGRRVGLARGPAGEWLELIERD